jgi:hypothetical protein
MSDSLALEILIRADNLRSERQAVWDPVYQDLSDYFLPQLSNIDTEKTEGVIGWTDRIYETTGIQAAQTLATGMQNWETPATEPWFEFEAPETMKEGADEAGIWLARATNITLKELARSNFYSKSHEDYMSIAVFGTGLLFVEEGKKTALNFRQSKVSTYTVCEDDEGTVDTVHHYLEMTAKQAVQQFGIDNVGEKIRKAFEQPKQTGLDKKFKFVHCVMPRDESKRIAGRMDGENKAIASIYVSEDDKACVKISGFDEMPYICSRFTKFGTQAPYGYSPAFLMLPNARQLNYVSQYMDALAELMAYPRLLYPDSLDGDVDLRAGGVTTYDSSNPNAKPEEWMTRGNYPLAVELLKEKRDAVNASFFVDMFQLLKQLQDKRMTAYEIAQRQAEKVESFRPIFDRHVTERLNPLLRRIFGILYRRGAYGVAPRGLMVPVGNEGQEALALPEIVITSRVSLALKASQNQGIVNTLSILEPILQSQPDLADNFDMDTLVRELARNNSIPPDIERPLKMVQEMRQARAQQMQAQQTIQSVQGIAKAGKDLNKAPKRMQDSVMGMMDEG